MVLYIAIKSAFQAIKSPHLCSYRSFHVTLTNGVALKQRPGESSYSNAVTVAAIEAITMEH
jgi:hypothetical protein